MLYSFYYPRTIYSMLFGLLHKIGILLGNLTISTPCVTIQSQQGTTPHQKLIGVSALKEFTTHFSMVKCLLYVGVSITKYRAEGFSEVVSLYQKQLLSLGVVYPWISGDRTHRGYYACSVPDNYVPVNTRCSRGGGISRGLYVNAPCRSNQLPPKA